MAQWFTSTGMEVVIGTAVGLAAALAFGKLAQLAYAGIDRLYQSELKRVEARSGLNNDRDELAMMTFPIFPDDRIVLPERDHLAKVDVTAVGVPLYPKEETVPAPPTGKLSLVEQYHTEGLTQSKIAFLFSIILAGFGFLVIAGSVIGRVFFNLSSDDIGLPLVSGTVIEATGALLFTLANRTRALMADFFDKLRVDKAVEEAIRLTESLPDPAVRSRLQAVLAVQLAEADVSDDLMQMVITGQSGDRSLNGKGTSPAPIAQPDHPG